LPTGLAARVLDPVLHVVPGVLQMGPGSKDVLIGGRPAWRGIPLAAAAGLQAAKSASDARLAVAKAATVAAAGTPGAPAAKAAEEALKVAEAAAMGATIASAAGGADLHTCVSAVPLPIPPPHGVGVVIDGSPTVVINGLPACRVADTILEAFGPPDKIMMGQFNVIIGQYGPGMLALLDAAGAAFKNAVSDFLAALTGSADKHKTQEQSNSCVVASTRNMILAKTGVDVPESVLRDRLKVMMGNPNHDFEAKGINPAFASQLLAEYGIKNTTKPAQTSADLETETSASGPVLIGFKNPGHRVMLDGVRTNPDGSKTYLVRDPDPAYGGARREMSQAEFDNKYNSSAITIVPDKPVP
jgi:uncharacterized Zn-binding protein involved in type VI secretion